MTMPYHRGLTCAQLVEYANAKHCRFCSTSLGPSKMIRRPPSDSLREVCNSSECEAKAAECCRELLPCGHACNGVVHEATHLPCLNSGCVAKSKALAEENKVPNNAVDGEEFCGICFVEGLGQAPCIRLSCSHTFHYQCVLNKIKQGPPTMRITFGYLECPLCKAPMDHKNIKDITKPDFELKKTLEEKARERLKRENLEKDARLVDPASRFYQKPVEYATAIFAYYRCFKCNKPYFGGRRDCENNADGEKRPKEEFVCFDCSDLPAIECKVEAHKEYHLWKCRFCCKLATWFCWGTTHFCDYCHSHEPWARAKWDRSKFTPCKGGDSCAVKKAHAPNGELVCLFVFAYRSANPRAKALKRSASFLLAAVFASKSIRTGRKTTGRSTLLLLRAPRAMAINLLPCHPRNPATSSPTFSVKSDRIPLACFETSIFFCVFRAWRIKKQTFPHN